MTPIQAPLAVFTLPCITPSLVLSENAEPVALAHQNERC